MSARQWHFEVGGSYGRWFVEKYDANENSRGTYGDKLYASSKKEAERLASALNNAFHDGAVWATTDEGE